MYLKSSLVRLLRVGQKRRRGDLQRNEMAAARVLSP